MFLFKRIGIGNMIKSILLTTVLLFGSSGFALASNNTPVKYHEAKMSKFRVQKNTLYHATRNSTVDMSEAAAIIGVESQWVTSARNKSGSSATGLFQFIDGTWRSERKRFGKIANVSSNAKRTDPRANIRIGIKSLEQNKSLIAANLGIREDRVALGDLYIAHLLGTDRAIRVIKGNPNALVSKYVKITKGNRNLYLTSKGKPRTVSQFRIAMNQKLINEQKLYKKEIQNFELSKLVEKLSTSSAVVINLPPNIKWYEQTS